MLTKSLMALVMVGMGLLLAYMPGAWKLIAYTVPTISFCLFIACVIKLLRSVGRE